MVEAVPGINHAPEVQAKSLIQTPLQKKACEFESMLLADWLGKMEEAERCEEGADRDQMTESYHDFTIQAVATAVVQSEGIGIAKSILAKLARVDRR